MRINWLMFLILIVLSRFAYAQTEPELPTPRDVLEAIHPEISFGMEQTKFREMLPGAFCLNKDQVASPTAYYVEYRDRLGQTMNQGGLSEEGKEELQKEHRQRINYNFYNDKLSAVRWTLHVTEGKEVLPEALVTMIHQMLDSAEIKMTTIGDRPCPLLMVDDGKERVYLIWMDRLDEQGEIASANIAIYFSQSGSPAVNMVDLKRRSDYEAFARFARHLGKK